MARIIATKNNVRRRTVTFTFDEGEPLELHADVAAEFRFRVDDEPDPAALEQAIARDAELRCRDGAWRLLSVRPRSRTELERALRQRRHLGPVIQRTLDDLDARGFLNDAAFARHLVDERIRRGHGMRHIQQELQSKGVSRTDSAPAIDDARDSDRDRETMRALLTKWNRRSKPEDPRKRATAAAGFLARRGFDPPAIWEVVRTFFSGIEEQQGGWTKWTEWTKWTTWAEWQRYEPGT